MTEHKNPDIYKVFDCLKDSYKYVDYREALFKENGDCKSIVSIFRFSDKSHEEIDSIHKELQKNKLSTEHFKINLKILNLEDWEKEWIRLKNQVRETNPERDLGNISISQNKKNRYTSWISEVDRKNNSIQFSLILNRSNHFKGFEFLEGHKEIRSIGAESIYPIIKQNLQINMFGPGVGLFSTFIFPTYARISELLYINNFVSGKVEYHEIFKESSVFIEIRHRGESLRIIGEHKLSSDDSNNKQTFLFFLDPKDFDKPELINYENELQLVIKLYFKPLNLNIIEFGVYLGNIKHDIINIEKIPLEILRLIKPFLQYNYLERKIFKIETKEFITKQTEQSIKSNCDILIQNKIWLLNNQTPKNLREFFISAANQQNVAYFNAFREFLVYTCTEGIKCNLMKEQDRNIILNDIVIQYGLSSAKYNYKFHYFQESLKDINEEIGKIYDKYFRKEPDCRKNDRGIYIKRFNYEYPKIYYECRYEISEDITCLIYFIWNDYKFFNFNSIHLGFWYHLDSKDIWNHQAESIINNTRNFINEIIDNSLITVKEFNNIPSQLLMIPTIEEEKKKSIEMENEWVKNHRLSLSEWKLGKEIYELKRFNIFVGKNNSGKTHALASIYNHQENLKIDKPSIQKEFRKNYPHHAVYENYYIPRYRVLAKSTGKRRNPKTGLSILLNTMQELQEQTFKIYSQIDERGNTLENTRFHLNLWRIPNFVEILDVSTYFFENEERLDDYNKEIIGHERGLLFIKALRKVFEEWVKIIENFIPDIGISTIQEKGIEGDIFLELKDKVLNLQVEDWKYYGSGTQEILSLIFIIEFLKYAPTVDYKQLYLSLNLRDNANDSLNNFISPNRNNRILLIDEPEISLHPSLQKKFFKYLYKSSKLIQIFIATNSPYFFNIKEIEDHLEDDISIFLCRKEKTEGEKFPKIRIDKFNYTKVIDDIFDYNPLETAIFLSSRDYSYITHSSFLENLKMVRNLISKRFESELDYIDLIKLGTLDFKYSIQLIQNVHFLVSKPLEVNLNSEGLKEDTLDEIYIFQMNRIPNLFSEMSNKIRFDEYVNNYYDKELLSKNSVGKYIPDKASDIYSKIERKLSKLEKDGIVPNRSLLVFPEISIPYLAINFLINFAKRNKIVIIGGLEHSTVEDINIKIQELKESGYNIIGEYSYKNIESKAAIFKDSYINQSIIINADQNISFQIKNIPFYKSKFTEGIPIIYNPFIRKIRTVFGEIAVFICKDFLVNYEIIDKWMKMNRVNLIVIPAFTSLVNPFRSKINTIIHNKKNQDKSFIFVNVAEFSGSGVFNYNKEKEHEPSMRQQFDPREEELKKFSLD